MVQVKQVILDPTNIAALNGTPAIALPKPPIGFINNILAISHNMKYVSSPYSGGSQIIYGSNNGTSVLVDSSVLGATGNYNLPAQKPGSGRPTIFSTTEDFYVTTDAAATGGDSTINAYIVFEQLQIGS